VRGPGSDSQLVNVATKKPTPGILQWLGSTSQPLGGAICNPFEKSSLPIVRATRCGSEWRCPERKIRTGDFPSGSILGDGVSLLLVDLSMLQHIAILLILLTCMSAQTTNPATPSAPSAPLIVLIGPPLSGKTTFAEEIVHTYGIPSISIEDLIRDNAGELDKLKGEGMSLADMRYDPAISRFLRERLKNTDLSHGLTLDGYPATLFQAEDLAKMFADSKMKLVALRLQVPDDTIRKRAKGAGRQIDRPEILEQRIKDYHREMDAIPYYFPKAKIVDIDGSYPEQQTWKQIDGALTDAGVKSALK
jgi:adenylate kinase family enzyme